MLAVFDMNHLCLTSKQDICSTKCKKYVSTQYFYEIFGMQYSFQKEILRPFSAQENFRSNRTFRSSARALFDFNNKNISSQKNMFERQKTMRK